MQHLNAPVLQSRCFGQGLPAAFNLRQSRQEDQYTASLRLLEGMVLNGA